MIVPAKRVPYAGTTVAPEKTQADIQKMLYNYGAQGTQWTEVGDQLELKFVFTTDDGRPMTFRIRPPVLKIPHREYARSGYTSAHGSVRLFVDKAASLRLLHWWLKAKLEAVSYGLVSMEEEFLSQIAGKLANGVEVTVGELLIPKLDNALGMTDLANALPAPKGGIPATDAGVERSTST